ncbi:MAG: hypothetical protein ACRCS6_09100 [Turicibacter sp.]
MKRYELRLYDEELMNHLDQIKKEVHFQSRNSLIEYVLQDYADKYKKEKIPHSLIEEMIQKTVTDEFKKRDNRLITLLGITLLESNIIGEYYNILLKNMDIDDYELYSARKKALHHTNKIIGGKINYE